MLHAQAKKMDIRNIVFDNDDKKAKPEAELKDETT